MNRIQFVCAVVTVLACMGCYQDRNESIKLMNDGVALIKGGNTTDGLRALKKAYEVDPTNHRAMYFEGMALVQGISKGGEALTDAAQKRRVSDAKTAEESLRGAIEIKDDDAEYHYQLGRALVVLEKHEQAVSAFARAVDLDPGHGKSLHRWGQSLEVLKKDNQAQDKYREALTKNPEHCHAFHDLGQLYMRYEAFNHAAKVFRNGTKNCPEFAPNFGELGFVYSRIENWEDAIEPLERATKLESRNASYYLSLALSHQAVGQQTLERKDTKRTIEHFKKSVRAFKAFISLSQDKKSKDLVVQARIEEADGFIDELEDSLRELM